MSRLEIKNVLLCDPANRKGIIEGPLYVEDGNIVDGLSGVAGKVIDGAGMVAMAGGVDMHSHIASPAVNMARLIQGDKGQGGGVIPHSFETGYRYAGLGYTTVVDAAVGAGNAMGARLAMRDIPNIDMAYLVLMGNHPAVVRRLSKGDVIGAKSLVGQILYKAGGFGLKVVNPCGMGHGGKGGGEGLWDIDKQVDGGLGKVSSRGVMTFLAETAMELGLSHPMHLHGNSLGLPGNKMVTMKTIEALDGLRAHLAHLQFHSYGQTAEGQYRSGAAEVAGMMNTNKNLTADVGQVMFGEAMGVTADEPLAHLLWQLTGNAYVSMREGFSDAGVGGCGCGAVELLYTERSYVNTIQWATGLELLLMIEDPWQIALSTDHPSGASFLTYPAIIAQLMSKNLRDEQMKLANQKAISQTGLSGLSREYSLEEIAVITRGGPARMLGMRDKGHLGAGADGDIVLYDKDLEDVRRMFTSPRWVIKGGEIVVEDGQIRDLGSQGIMDCGIGFDERGDRLLDDWLRKDGAVSLGNYGVR